MHPEWVQALIGGVLIGISVSFMLLWNGRVAGISGILYGSLNSKGSDRGWRISFLLGLIAGGLTLRFLNAEVFTPPPVSEGWIVAIAGLLVGFGTVLGSGCTSGHGVCGVSRLSLRSIIATVLFIVSGVIAVASLRSLGGFL